MVIGVIAVAWLLTLLAFAMAWSCFCYHCSDIRSDIQLLDPVDDAKRSNGMGERSPRKAA